MQDFDKASRIQREFGIVKFQMLQLKPRITLVRERIEQAEKLRQEIEVGSYKDRVSQIKREFLEV